MDEVEFKNGPLLAGWAIAAGAGLVAGALCVVLGDFDLSPAVAIGGVLFLVVGLILGLPWSKPPAPVAVAAPPVWVPPPAPSASAFSAPAPLMAAPAAQPALSPRRPDAMAAARDGGPDDLKKIKGVGPVLEKLLHSLGYFHFDQIAAWTADEVAWVDDNLEGFKGRVTRDDWVPQAKILAAGGSTEFSRRVEDGEVY